MLIAFIILGLIAGGVIPFQTSINTRLSHYTQSAFYASTISFFVGTICLVLITLILHPNYLSLHALTAYQLDYTWFVGGIMGVLFLTGNLLLLPKVGASLTVVTTITGQLIMGCLIDAFGWFNVTPQPFTLIKGIGLTLLILGITLMNIQRRHPRIKQSTQNVVLWLILGLIFGCAPPIQAAINSSLGQSLNSPFFAALISFAVGTLTLFVITALVHRRYQIQHEHAQFGPLRWWYFIGGLLGVLFVTTTIILTAQIGVTYTLITVMLGQIITSLLIDHFGLLGITPRKISKQRILGLIIILFAISLIQFIH
ncbi:DMT family transporter [Staphylococcus americanisciuri]|uniref:DMT family transporter n=1 Tax=Staphylococcus americanisciuri TaxID=2973940 RepID=A0ABT2F2W7_9STAP|nr:DMT family transporter [Staphylococcus americanisciuri]MCS4486508.1 DMT family transporter [Staphylococcus americanisciuri]